MGALTSPTVSVVVLNWNGGDDTLRCLASLRLVEDPGGPIEVVVVDNGSTDGSADRIAKAHPEVTLIRLPLNRGFAGGANAGAGAARGELVAFLNNDAVAEPSWLVEAAAVMRSAADVAAVGSRVTNLDGTTVDFEGGGVTFYGFGYRERFGQPVETPETDSREVLFGTGSALLVRRSVFIDVGGFDERFFAFFEDVDLGWRLWLLGHRVLYAPRSVVRHAHHATMDRQGRWKEDFLLDRNALMAVIKNLDDRRLGIALGASALLGARRVAVDTGIDDEALDLEADGPVSQAALESDGGPSLTVDKRALAPLLAWAQIGRRLPDLLQARAEIQRRRVRTDEELFRLVANPMVLPHPGPELALLRDALDGLLGVEDAFAVRKRVAVVTGDPLGAKLSGPGIRAVELARVLSAHHDVRVASTNDAELSLPGIAVSSVRTTAAMRALERWADVIVFQGFLLSRHPWLAGSDRVLIVDLYDPFHLEQLEQTRGEEPGQRVRECSSTVGALNQMVQRGDTFLCASAKQRDLWVGHLAAVGRVNPYTYDDDSSLDRLLRVVPFGIPDQAPTQTRRPLKGVLPGIAETDKVVLWGGGIYPWFDPGSLIHAVTKVACEVPTVRLVFLAGRHPNPDVPEMRSVGEARALAERLGVLGTHVFFYDRWVDYDDRHNFLLDADLGVSVHQDHIETAFSFRTRILDYLWARLPVVATAGDAMGDLIASRGFGAAVPPGDIDGLAAAITALLADPDMLDACRERIERYAPGLAWATAAAPLLDACNQARRAPDLLLGLGPAVRAGHVEATLRAHTRHAAGRFVAVTRQYGITEAVGRAARRIPRAVAKRTYRLRGLAKKTY